MSERSTVPWDELRLTDVEEIALKCGDACSADVVSLIAEVRALKADYLAAMDEAVEWQTKYAEERARRIALEDAARAMVAFLNEWGEIVVDIVVNGDPGSHVGRLTVSDYRELFARKQVLDAALRGAEGREGE